MTLEKDLKVKTDDMIAIAKGIQLKVKANEVDSARKSIGILHRVLDNLDTLLGNIQHKE